MSTLLVMPSCSATCSAAGAIIDEDTGLMNVKDDTTMVAAHFWRYGQLEYIILGQCQLDKKKSHDPLFWIHWISRAVPVDPQYISVTGVGCLCGDIFCSCMGNFFISVF